jgi:hypothetical protein
MFSFLFPNCLHITGNESLLTICQKKIQIFVSAVEQALKRKICREFSISLFYSDSHS